MPKLSNLTDKKPRFSGALRLDQFKRLEVSAKINALIASELDLQKTLDSITGVIFDNYHPYGISIMILDKDELRVVAGRSAAGPKDTTQSLSLKLGEGVAGRAALLGQPQFVEDTLDDPKFVKPKGRVTRIRSVLSVTMKVRGKVTGVINVSFSDPRRFNSVDIDILQAIATPAAYAIQNASLFEKIYEERSKLQLIQESMRGGLTVSKPDGSVVFINDSAKEMFGVSGKIIGKSPLQLLSHMDKYSRYKIKVHFSVPETIAGILKGQTAKGMIEVQSNPPRHIEALCSAMRDERGQVIGIIGNYRDVSELISQSDQIKKQLSHVETEQVRWKAIFDNVEEAIVIVAADGTISQANPSTQIVSELDPNKIIGQKFETVFPLKNSRNVSLADDLSLVRTVQRTHEAIEYAEAKFSNAEGREVWVGLSLTPISANESGQVIVVMRNISRLKEIDQAKSDFLSMASHELRTPLTVINGYISLLMSGDLGDIQKPELAHFRQVVAQIHKNTERLNKLVEDLLNVSRIEQGRLNLNLERLNLEILVSETAEEMRRQAESKGHVIMYTQPVKSFLSFPLIVKADRDKIRQVLINLIDNAIKYTPHNGKIDLTIKRSGREAIVLVSDSGPGIPKQLVPRVFEKFQRLEGSYVKDSVGTGLGLYIVRELLRVHGGRVWVESQVGEGSSFFFSLPLYKD